MNVMFYLSSSLLFSSAGLVLGDGMITTRGLGASFPETNPVLARVIGKLGVKGLWTTRLVALFCLFLLFLILSAWEWIEFSSVFVVVMSYVVARGVLKLKQHFQGEGSV